MRLLADSSCKRFEIHPPVGSNNDELIRAFGLVFSMLSGKYLNAMPEMLDLIGYIAAELEFGELSDWVQSFGHNVVQTDVTNIYDRLASIHVGGSSPNFTNTIEFAASNFYQLDFQQLLPIRQWIVEKIIDCPNLRLKNELQLFEFVEHEIERNGKMAYSLLSRVKFEFIDPKSISKFSENAEFESFSVGAWKALCGRLKCNVEAYAPPSSRWVEQPIPITSEKIESFQKQIETLKNRISAFEQENSDLKVSIDEKSSALYTMKCDASKLKADLDGEKAKSQQEVSLSNSLKSKISNLEKANSDLKAENSSISASSQRALDEERTNSARMKATSDSLSAKVSELGKENSDMRNTISQLREEISGLHSQMHGPPPGFGPQGPPPPPGHPGHGFGPQGPPPPPGPPGPPGHGFGPHGPPPHPGW